MKNLLLLLFAAGIAFVSGGTEYRIGCEDFPETDTIRLVPEEKASGGKFLHFTAQGAETSADFDLPESGEYYVWLRSLSFGGSFRKLEIHVNGKCVAVLGDGKPENGVAGTLSWYRSDDKIRLDAGKISLRLVSTSPYTRADVIVLSPSDAFKATGKCENLLELTPVKKEDKK